MHTPLVSADYSAWDDDADAAEIASDIASDIASEIAASPEVALSEADPPRLLLVDEATLGERLDKWLARKLPEHSRSRLQAWIEAGAVRVNGAPSSIRQAVWGGDRIEVTPIAAPESNAFLPEPIALDIVFEDETILVINKPAGLVVHPAAGNWSGTLLNGLLHHLPASAGVARAGIVHRLDKDTSGLMVVAKSALAQTDLVRQLQARTVKREYLAVVHGSPPASGSIDAPIGRHPRERTRMAAFKMAGPVNKPALTHFRVLQQVDLGKAGGGAYALICCRLETGRTHQIRVHMQHIGHALVGDPVYGSRQSAAHGFTRQALHAWRLGLIHPLSRIAREWSASPPEDFESLLAELGLRRGGSDMQ